MVVNILLPYRAEKRIRINSKCAKTISYVIQSTVVNHISIIQITLELGPIVVE
jgi:hypothetical protein